MPSTATENLANQLKMLAQMNPGFIPPTAEQIDAMGPADIINLAQSLPGIDAYSCRLKQSVLLINMTRDGGPNVY